ncbi:diguanylate cyclase domain-containing protein [Roseibium aggregatum]|uniref:Diguanylate cyclase n=1 Tax=Roseibium aggregatum TaxID=187304 RepID=A0A939EI17_9HYPH|nr:diguanylate cyclase [Roseibium aggregatum]MBN9673577.1 diguanylate cyclase [Roseibium aggregatum]
MTRKRHRASDYVRCTTGGPDGSVRLRRFVYGSISLLLAGGVFAMAYLFLSTTQSADSLALRYERSLVTEALKHSQELAARHQTFVAVNDQTVSELRTNDTLDPEFAREIARQMWSDFHDDWTLILDGKNTPVLVAAEDELLAASAGREIVEATRDLVARARIGYQTARRPTKDGYRIRYVEKGRLAPIYATDIRDIGGKPALVSAMAIVPATGGVSLPDGPPGVLVSVSLIEKAFLEEMADTLLLKGFQYTGGAVSQAASVPVATRGHSPVGSFEWTSGAPGARIRTAIGPIAVALILSFLAIGAYFARKLAQRSKALEDSEARNRHMATHDLMTGLANRVHFREIFDRAITDCHTCPCTVMAIDLDRFKEVNDTYGHEAGDMVIRQVARRLHAALPDDALIARMGGDEFMVLLTGDIGDERIRWLCDSVIDAVTQPIPVSGGMARIGASIGWASAPKHADAPSHLLSLADRALYSAKENGRNRAVCIEDLYERETRPSERRDEDVSPATLKRA